MLRHLTKKCMKSRVQLARRSLKLCALAKLRSIDSCQNGTCEDPYQITNNVTLAQIHDLTFRPINPPLQPRLKCLTNTRSQQSVYSKIRILMKVQSIDNCQTTASTDHHHLTVSWAQLSAHWVWVFWSYPLTSYYFSNDCRLKFNFLTHRR